MAIIDKTICIRNPYQQIFIKLFRHKTSPGKKENQTVRAFTNHLISNMSGKRGSNSRPSAWEADALPTELLPHVFFPAFFMRIASRYPVSRTKSMAKPAFGCFCECKFKCFFCFMKIISNFIFNYPTQIISANYIHCFLQIT